MDCIQCGRDVSDKHKRIQVFPCRHLYCYHCFIKQQIESSACQATLGKRMACSCGEHVDNHEWCSDEGTDNVESIDHADAELHESYDAFRLWMRGIGKDLEKHGREYVFGSKGLLFSTFWTVNWTEEEGWDIVDVSFALSANGSWLPSSADADNLFACCCFLHTACHPLSSTYGGEIQKLLEDSGLEAFTLSQLFNFIVREDNRLMPRIFYALATGDEKYVMAKDEYDNPIYWDDVDQSIPPNKHCNAHHRSAILAPYMGCDLAMRATKPHEEVGMGIRTMTATVAYKSDSQRHDILSACRLITGAKHLSRTKAKIVMKEMSKGIKLGPRDLLKITVDNVEKKRKDGSFLRYFSVLHYQCPEEDLVSMGVYDDGTSFKEIDFEEFMEGKSKEDVIVIVFRAGEKEFGRLGGSCLTHIAITFEAMRAGDLPPVDWCRDSITAHQYCRPGTKRPVLYRYSAAEDVQQYIEEREDFQPATTSTITEEKRTLWNVNSIKGSVIGHGSFGKKVTILALMDYLNRVGDAQVKEWLDNGGDPSQMPISSLCRFILGDGAPMMLGLTILDEDIIAASEAEDDASNLSEDGKRIYSSIKLLLGAFHFYMQLFKKANQLGQKMATFLASTFKGTSDISLKYYLKFSDPTNPEKEMSSMLLAIYAYAIRCMKRQGVEAASATMVHDFMIERSKECPAAMALLNLVLNYETVILARRAMRLSNFDLLISCVKLAVAIFSETHSTGYERIICDFLERIVTMSTAERIITEKKGFTGETEHGENMACDQIHEKYVRQIRRLGGGKTAKTGDEALLEFASLAATDDERARDGRDMEDLRKGGFEHRYYKPISDDDFEAYATVTVALEDSDIFEPGSAIRVKGEIFDDPNRYLSPINGQPVLAEIIHFRKSGQEKGEKFFENFNMDNRHQVYRSEKEMGIPAVESTSKEIEALLKKRYLRGTTLSRTVLNANGTRKEIHAELGKMAPYLGVEAIPTNVSPESAKDVISKSVIRLRKRLSKEEIRAVGEMARRSADMTSTPEQRVEDLSHMYYLFPAGTKANAIFTRLYQINDL